MREVGETLRHVRRVELLDPAEPDQPGGHPVGEDHEVAPGVLARGELRLDLGEELVVVVDVLGVVDLDPGRLVNASRVGRCFSSSYVDVLGPVGPVDDLLLAERSVEATVSPLRPAAGMPHAVSPPVATTPSPAARSSERRARAPRPLVILRAMAASCGGERVSYCSMDGALPRDRPGRTGDLNGGARSGVGAGGRRTAGLRTAERGAGRSGAGPGRATRRWGGRCGTGPCGRPPWRRTAGVGRAPGSRPCGPVRC